jgi:hypothetical protein
VYIFEKEHVFCKNREQRRGQHDRSEKTLFVWIVQPRTLIGAQFMLLGGNSKAREYFKKHGMDSQPTKVKYSNTFTIQYKEQLKVQVENMYVYVFYHSIVTLKKKHFDTNG